MSGRESRAAARPWDRPVMLLVATGALLGLNFPLAKHAVGAGVSPALWAAWISLGAGLAVAAVARGRRRSAVVAPPTGRVLRYGLVSGVLSYVMPNLLTFTVIPRIGAGLAAVMFAMSPVVTALLALLLGVRAPTALGLAGIALGLAGALLIVLGRPGGAAAAEGARPLLWIALALLVPVFLGLGNIYRTLAWPDGAGGLDLAALTNLMAAPILLSIALILDGGLDLAPFAAVPGAMLAQLAVSTAMFLMFFRLQRLGGPTYLSQIGYVAAAIGLGIGATWLGERYPPSVWAGAGIIASGIALTTLAQRRAP